MKAEPKDRALEALEAVIDGQREVYEHLSELVVEQRRALLAGDEAKIEELAERGQTMSTRYRLLDRERNSLEEGADDALLEESQAARERAAVALQNLLREAAISGVVLSRLGDTVAARRTAIDLILGGSYLSSGRPRGVPATGRRFSAGG